MRHALAACTVTATCLLIAACGSSSSSPSASSATSSAPASSAPAATANAGLAKLVPASIRSSGQLTDLVNSPFPPMEYQANPGGPIVGVDIDIARAIAQTLGLKLVVTNTPNFSELIPAVESHRTDIVESGTFDLRSRQGVVHFVNYFRTGDQFLALKARAGGMTSNKSMCGKTVVVQAGTSYPTQIAALSASECGSSTAIKVLTVQTPPDQLQQVTIGRADALVQGPEGNEYVSQQHPGQWQAVGTLFHPVDYGIMFSKSNPQLGVALRDALNSLIKSGAYQKILAKWHLSQSALSSSTIDQTSSP